ncbi:MAG: nitroreductase [Thiothrix nivea]|nr:MAG: nitroreductase [Thiothrix nivea]
MSSGMIALAVDQVIQARKTVKALGDIHHPPEIPEGFYREVQAAITMASWAPFHFPAHEAHLRDDLDSPVPWRFYTLNQNNCLRFARSILAQPELETDEDSGIIRMMAACGALVLVTWLPEPEDSFRARDAARRTFIDEEHLAATAAATQNLLLAAKAREIDSYWSSGGVLRDWACFEMCGIPLQEKLLGAIFLFPELPDHLDVRSGKLRDRRGSPQQWMRWVDI